MQEVIAQISDFEEAQIKREQMYLYKYDMVEIKGLERNSGENYASEKEQKIGDSSPFENGKNHFNIVIQRPF